ncbi:Proteophosphoglycan ppg4 [Mycena kentingensis (nom. inval.)]|nr:Proteophosphoglycan ppg4 [Mycena kentingensis (nom. inval.)]
MVEPWIHAYLLQTMHNYHNTPLDAVPTTKKPKLILNIDSENATTTVWAIASDTAHSIAVKLTTEDASRVGPPTTVSLESFRPVCTKTPDPYSNALSRDRHMALVCDALDVGNFGGIIDASVGVQVNNEDDISAWVDELKQGIATVLRRDSLVLLLAGGLALMSFRKPLGDWAGFVYAKGDIRSLFGFVVCSIVLLVLGTSSYLVHNVGVTVAAASALLMAPRSYLTNPSENSFRAYLTEQSFRHHLSRLEATSDDQDSKLGSSQRRGTPPPANGSPFHFANRATVSLRTPKHVFHSFGIFTVAAIIPSRTDRPQPRDATIVTDSWFIGAFGKWYRGGVLDAWYQDVVARSSDEESWTSGILGMKALDKFNDYDGLPFSTKNLPASRSPPKLRNRDKSSQRLPARSSTPPPLPKSASLPLHTPRTSPSERLPPSSQPAAASEQNRLSSPSLSRSPSTLFDQSPRIAEVLQQISASRNSVLELRTQLADFQVTASTSHAALQGEVDAFRERKRQEDASRSELKSRTKALDDSKRAAESVKRDADKRLKAAQSSRDDARQRMEFLDKEIELLTRRRAEDETSVTQRQHVSQTEQEIAVAVDNKRHEIKATEDVIVALNSRARELEDRLASERERLKLVRERAELRKQDRSFQPYTTAAPAVPWTIGPRNYYDAALDGSDLVSGRNRRSSDPHSSFPTSPRPAKLSLGSLSNFNPGPQLAHPNGYSIYDDAFNGQPHLSGNFSPFGDPSMAPTILSPTSQSLIPSGLISSLDSGDGPSRSFQSDSDAFVDKDWREASLRRARSQQRSEAQHSPAFGPLTSSPTSVHGPSFNGYERDPFEVSVLTSPSLREREFRLSGDGRLVQRGQSDPTGGHEDVNSTATDKAGLTPDAKEFSLPTNRKAAATSPRLPSYDALNPNGLGSSMMAPASTNNSLLRAFAPSPAEREVLHRALGGSSNTSLERLPSLSDVGSIPSSPAHVHAHAVVPPPPQRAMDNKGLPSWLASLPRIRKPNFSPFDEEPVTGR